jgi:hypothetical protein
MGGNIRPKMKGRETNYHKISDRTFRSAVSDVKLLNQLWFMPHMIEDIFEDCSKRWGSTTNVISGHIYKLAVKTRNRFKLSSKISTISLKEEGFSQLSF